MVLKIAITGNIASGKSQAEKMLKEMGFAVYDSDKIAHEVLNTINDFYGYDVFTNGKIDRYKLGTLVFSKPELRKKLEDITHPKIKSVIFGLFEKHKSDKYIFVSVPLLYEAGFDNLFDKVILISVNEEIQLSRLIARNNYSKEDAIKRINAQIPQREKINKADFVVNNDSSFENLNKQIKNVLEQL